MQIKFMDRRLTVFLTSLWVFGHSSFVTADVKLLQPKLTGFFLGEYIYSNYNQSSLSGNRFAQVSAFDILCFPRAVFNVQANANDNAPVNAFMGFNFRSSCCYGNKNDPWSFTKCGSTDHAYIKIKNERLLQLEALFGIQYLPFGNYENNKIPAPFTQLLTEIQAGALVLNASLANFTLSGFIFNGKKALNTARSINNFGLQVQYARANYNFKVGYVYNIANSVDYLLSSFGSQAANPLATTYKQKVSSLALNSTAVLPLDSRLELGFTAALNRFNLNDINWYSNGAKPGAVLIRLGRKFSLLGYQHNFSVNYQYSWQALNVRGPNLARGLPKQRYQLDWVIEPFKDVEFGAHYIIDLAYQAHLISSKTFIMTVSYLFDLTTN